MDQTDPWQVVPRQVFTPYDCSMISVVFVVLFHVGYLRVTGVIILQEYLWNMTASLRTYSKDILFFLQCFVLVVGQ